MRVVVFLVALVFLVPLLVVGDVLVVVGERELVILLVVLELASAVIELIGVAHGLFVKLLLGGVWMSAGRRVCLHVPPRLRCAFHGAIHPPIHRRLARRPSGQRIPHATLTVFFRFGRHGR